MEDALRLAPFSLRRLDPERDGPALHSVFGDPDSCRYLAGPETAKVAQTVRLLRAWSAGCEETSWAIVETVGGDAVGRIAVIPRGRDIWEAACMIVPKARGQNLAARGLAKATDYAFDELGARRVFGDADVENLASICTFEKLGFKREGVLRGNWETHLGVRDSVILGLLRDDPRPWRRSR
jgi:RimJ/RimL family protein N-acetyltransferase